MVRLTTQLCFRQADLSWCVPFLKCLALGTREYVFTEKKVSKVYYIIIIFRRILDRIDSPKSHYSAYFVTRLESILCCCLQWRSQNSFWQNIARKIDCSKSLVFRNHVKNSVQTNFVEKLRSKISLYFTQNYCKGCTQQFSITTLQENIVHIIAFQIERRSSFCGNSSLFAIASFIWLLFHCYVFLKVVALWKSVVVVNTYRPCHCFLIQFFISPQNNASIGLNYYCFQRLSVAEHSLFLLKSILLKTALTI